MTYEDLRQLESRLASGFIASCTRTLSQALCRLRVIASDCHCAVCLLFYWSVQFVLVLQYTIENTGKGLLLDRLNIKKDLYGLVF